MPDTRAYHEYDYPPPQLRHLSSERLPSVSSNPLGSASNTSPPYSSQGSGKGFLGGRRQSWTDLVAESEKSSVSDLSLVNASLNQSFGPLPTMEQLGPRRSSWLNLMESDENIHVVKEDRIPTVFHKPEGRAMTNLHKAPPRDAPDGQFRLMSVGDTVDRLQNSHNYRREGGTAHSSPTEFILVVRVLPKVAL